MKMTISAIWASCHTEILKNEALNRKSATDKLLCPPNPIFSAADILGPTAHLFKIVAPASAHFEIFHTASPRPSMRPLEGAPLPSENPP